jgi:hypothetical protein
MVLDLACSNMYSPLFPTPMPAGYIPFGPSSLPSPRALTLMTLKSHNSNVGDVHLMDLLVGADAYPDDVLRIINHCRLFLNVVTLSDITNAAGTHLIPGVDWGELDLFPSSSTHHAPRQASPAMFFWTYWQRLLRIIALPSGRLNTPLGPWLKPGSELRRTWNSYYITKLLPAGSNINTRLHYYHFLLPSRHRRTSRRDDVRVGYSIQKERSVGWLAYRQLKIV